MTYVETSASGWKALAGRAPGEPTGAVDTGLWGAVVDRLNPARARPVLRAGIEAVQLASARGTDYVMLRSPEAGYLRLTPEQWQLALLMDGEHSVTLLVAEYARIAGRLAPDEVRRVVADLAGNRMLDDLPREAFRPLPESSRVPPAEREGSVAGRRMLVFPVDGLVTALYRAGGRVFFGRAGTVLTALLAVAGLVLFVPTWSRGSRSLFLTGGSYLLGALVLLVLNAVVLGLHQLARALAARHAGREVPAGGLLIRFGVPALFADTSDVWMAGRRARMLVSAAGPLGALLLAGLVQLAGLAVPAIAGVTFKLAFLAYLHAFFRLSPLLPLDGQFLLADWLEIPHLRARALSWVGDRLRGRPPVWSALDAEARLIALYGFLSIAWLAVAANLAVLVWTDRIDGLATGLWHDGVFGALLFLLIVLGMTAPPVYFLVARLTRWSRDARQRRAEGDREADAPRRLAALRASDLGGLPDAALQSLASRARWLHPPHGRRLVHAGAAQSAVYVVVEGALAARRPGDPTGTIRHQVGPGGVVGLVDALTGRSAELDWHTAGTSLLAVPAATVATVVGPLPGPPPNDRAEAESLFADTPALADLAADQRLALIASAHPVDLGPGVPVVLSGPTHAVVVESGVIALPDGVELRRGTLVGPVGEGNPGAVAQTRTPVRLWVMPDASAIPPLVGAKYRPGTSMPAAARPGVLRPGTPGESYPPLAVPPVPPEEFVNPEVDNRFRRVLTWLVALVLVFALALTVLNFRPGPAWAEMPTGDVLVAVHQGRITGVVGGDRVPLEAGAERYLTSGDQLEVPTGANAQITFRGGSFVVLCAGARVELGRMHTDGGRQPAPSAVVVLQSGRILAGTASTSGAYQPLSLTVTRQQGDAVSSGGAWFSAEPSDVTVATGTVSVGGTVVPPTGTDLSCGDGIPVNPPAPAPSTEPELTGAPLPEPTSASTIPSVSPSPRQSPSASATGGPDPDETTPPPTLEAPTIRPPTVAPTGNRPTSRPPTPSTTPSTVPTEVTSSPTAEPTEIPSSASASAETDPDG